MAKMRRVYLDTSILIAEFDKKDPKHKILTDALAKFKRIQNVEICYSKWVITEMYNKLTKNKIEELKIVKYVKDILDKNRIRALKLTLLEVSPKKNYDFHDFFNELTHDLIKYKTGKDKPGLGDVMHIRIMKNNRIKHILTFDSDFDEIQGIVSINLLSQGKKNEATDKLQAN